MRLGKSTSTLTKAWVYLAGSFHNVLKHLYRKPSWIVQEFMSVRLSTLFRGGKLIRLDMTDQHYSPNIRQIYMPHERLKSRLHGQALFQT